MRMTQKKRAILEKLAGQGPADFFERGTPPYSAADVAHVLDYDLSNTVKTLRTLERDGMVVREVAKRHVWNAIAGGHMPRTCTCYWNAGTMERDRADAEQWRAGSRQRSDAALTKMFG